MNHQAKIQELRNKELMMQTQVSRLLFVTVNLIPAKQSKVEPNLKEEI